MLWELWMETQPQTLNTPGDHMFIQETMANTLLCQRSIIFIALFIILCIYCVHVDENSH